MLKLNNISKKYGQKKALDNISGVIELGDFLVIVGTNGSGKSTLLQIITGAQKTTSGAIYHENKEITQLNQNQRALWISKLHQNPGLNCEASMTVIENFALTLQKGKIATLASMITTDKKEKILIELHKFNLQHLIDTPMKDLSGGQRQLLAFIMATMTNPQLLLLDEPTAALDPSAATLLLKTALLHNKNHKLTTILITHDPEIALAIASKIWILNNGTIIKEYTHDQIHKIKANDLIGHINYDDLRR